MPALSEAILTPILAFCVAVLLMPLLNRFAVKAGFVDVPNARKIHSHPIPVLGGLAVYAGVIIALILRGQMDARVTLMMFASFLVMLLGVADDRLDLHSRYRLILQVILAAGLSLSGVRFHLVPFAPLDHLITVFWVVGVINAMNCLDCADGAAGGTCVVVFFALGMMAAAAGRSFVSQASFAAMGAVLGFLVFNVPPARVFLGDAGSTFLGLMVAVLAILANAQPTGGGHFPLTPFVLLVPVVDIAWVHYRRYQAGIRSIRDLLSSTGKDHLPHRLMTRGLSKRACMAVVTFLTALAAGAVCLVNAGLWLVAAMAVFALAAFLWHVEENSEIVIRPGDSVAIYQLRTEKPVLQPALHHEEGVA
ncbi:MAG: glycosyl transferase family 4 [Armatimonadetes bacterium]|nr:glycosyl transferase family 4 [Armatimonadota bacterium]